MRREIITTADGSKTIHIPDWDEQYHSKHGAIQEAYHVFIKHGLSLFANRSLAILEVGLGTGLNALITLMEGQKSDLKIHYTGIERYPISMTELLELNYISQLDAADSAAEFLKIHESDWEKNVEITKGFVLQKQQLDFNEIDAENQFDLVFFDAFGARVQPELWTEEIFEKMYRAMKKGAILVTYSAKGSVRRAMQTVGFAVERLPGPPGKREMLRATK